MARGIRAACILVPYAMTIVSLILIILVIVGGRSSDSTLSIYAWEADFSTYKVSNQQSQAQTALQDAKTSGRLPDHYRIYLFNSCNGNNCSVLISGYVFDPIVEWNLNTTAPLSGDYNNAMDAYRAQAKWMDIAFSFALALNAGTVLSGFAAIFSRYGSVLTWILSSLTSIFIFAAACNATVIFGGLVGSLRSIFEGTGADISLGSTFFTYAWTAATVSLLTTAFWLFSIFCCGGDHNPHHRNKRGGLWNAEPKHGPPKETYHAGLYTDEMPLRGYSASRREDRYEPYATQQI